MVRKLAVVVLAVAMVMSCMGLASAAKFPDTAGHKQEAAIDRIASLGLVKGYPDGTFKPDAPITRAEFAKVMVCALGLEAAAEMMATTPTVFADVPVGYWATGYINVAASQGIVNGYPDGTFKPDANVTYAEALKMILCALGYKPEVFRTIVWPVTWIAKAMELGLTSGVPLATGAAALPANRGDVAAMVNNALGVPKLIQVGFGDEIKYVVSGTQDTDLQTLLGDLGYTKVSGRVEDVGVLFGTELTAADKIKIQPSEGSAKVYTVTAADVDLRKLIGLEVVGWANSDGEIIAFTSIKDADVKTGYVVGYRAATQTALAEVDIGSATSWKTYKLLGNAVVVVDHELDGTPSVSSAGYGEKYLYARYLLKDGKVVLLDVVDYGDPMIVDEVNTTYSRIYLKGGGTGSRIEYEDWNVKVTRDGKPAQVTDLEEDDVIYKWDDGEENMVIEAFSGKVTGELEAAHTAWANVTVDGTKYSLIRTAEALLSVDDGATYDDWSNADAGALLGKEVTLLKGHGDKVVAMAGLKTAPVTVANYALVYDVVEDSLGDIWARLITTDGKKVRYQITPTTLLDGSPVGSATYAGVRSTVMGWTYADIPVPPGSTTGLGNNMYLAKIKVASDGTLASLSAGVTVSADDLVLADVSFSDKYNRLTIGTTTGVVTDATAILDISGWNTQTVKKVAFSAVRGQTVDDGGTGLIKNGEALVVVLLKAPAVAVADRGVVVGKALTADGYRLTVNLAGTEKAFTFDPDLVSVTGLVYDNHGNSVTGDLTKITVGELVYLGYDVKGDLNKIVEPEYNVEGEVDSVSASVFKVVVGGTAYFGTEKTAVYDCRGTVPQYVDFAAIRRGDLVQIFRDAQGVITEIKIITP